jgi:hypothetical protein
MSPLCCCRHAACATVDTYSDATSASPPPPTPPRGAFAPLVDTREDAIVAGYIYVPNDELAHVLTRGITSAFYAWNASPREFVQSRTYDAWYARLRIDICASADIHADFIEWLRHTCDASVVHALKALVERMCRVRNGETTTTSSYECGDDVAFALGEMPRGVVAAQCVLAYMDMSGSVHSDGRLMSRCIPFFAHRIPRCLHARIEVIHPHFFARHTLCRVAFAARDFEFRHFENDDFTLLSMKCAPRKRLASPAPAPPRETMDTKEAEEEAVEAEDYSYSGMSRAETHMWTMHLDLYDRAQVHEKTANSLVWYSLQSMPHSIAIGSRVTPNRIRRVDGDTYDNTNDDDDDDTRMVACVSLRV